MPATSTPRTPEGKLIRRARSRLSIPAAAARIGISTMHWGNIERGWRSTGSGKQEAVTGTPTMIALMARAVGLTPDELAAQGERPDAAAELAALAGVPEPPSADASQGAIIAGVRALYPGDQVAEAIMTQWDKPLEQRQRELGRWRGSADAARA